MIGITFTEPDSQSWAAWRHLCDQEQQRINTAKREGTNCPFRREVYKGTRFGIKESVFLNEEGPFSGKCAYCEEQIARSQHGDVEHYRPMAEVRDANNVIALVVIEGVQTAHPGYFWLAYDWRNLVPSCVLCNKQPARSKPFGKGNRFPVQDDSYATRPGEEGDELPLLLNPTVDNPSDHIDVNELGVICWRTIRGQLSVEILGLNERGLPNARREKHDEALNTVGALLRATCIDPAGNEATRLTDKLERILSGKDEHAMAGRRGARLARDRAAAVFETSRTETA